MRMGTRAFVIALLCCTSLLGFLASPAAAATPKQKVLEYYVHESLNASNTTFAAWGSQNGNLSFTGFGFSFTIDNVIKDGGNEDSEVIGYGVSMATRSNHPGMLSHLTFTQTLNNTKFGVGRLESAGNIDFSLPIKPSQLVVSGGTGDFKFYSGVIDIFQVYNSSPVAVYKNTLTLVKY